MQDFILTAPTEADLIPALPEYRVSSEEGEQWAGNVIHGCTRWVTRPQFDAEGNVTNTPEIVPGFHAIIRADSLPGAVQQYLVADPGDIEPIPAGGLVTPEVPQVVSKFQGKAALLLAGKLDAVEALIADPSTDPIIKLAWTEVQEMRRQSPAILALWAAMGGTDAELDQLFIAAARIEA